MSLTPLEGSQPTPLAKLVPPGQREALQHLQKVYSLQPAMGRAYLVDLGARPVEQVRTEECVLQGQAQPVHHNQALMVLGPQQCPHTSHRQLM